MLFEWFIRSGACGSLWILKTSFWCIGTRTTTWLIRNLWVYTISTQKSSRLSCTVGLLFDVKKSERGQAGICQTENSFSAPMTFSHKPCSVKLNTKHSNWKQCGISLLPEKYNSSTAFPLCSCEANCTLRTPGPSTFLVPFLLVCHYCKS